MVTAVPPRIYNIVVLNKHLFGEEGWREGRKGSQMWLPGTEVKTPQLGSLCPGRALCHTHLSCLLGTKQEL